MQPAIRRKLIYVVLIIALLFFNTFLWRGVASPLTQGELPRWTVAAQANKLLLTDLAAGSADVAGSAVRLMLTGSRGLALAVLWYQSDEKKKKHEWNKMELLVNTITKLQPHSPAAWLYQSWNIAYNVSVESDSVKDKYFYIAKGIQLLADGIKLNKDQPDMRYMEGFYYQNKFGVADETNSFRSLFQLSCIDPRLRDAAKMRSGDTLDMAEFEKFVQEHPQLVRRLKEKLNMSPEAIVDFLRNNHNVPCRYYDPTIDGKTGLKPMDVGKFPTLPMESSQEYPDIKTEDSLLGDDFDNYMAARAWFAYAQDPLPPPSPQIAIRERLDIARETGKRIPRSPALVIFRHLPIRAQSFIGERLEKEGWFDESGWDVDADRSGVDRWFTPDKKVVVGSGNNYNQEAWTKAFTEWEKHGQRNGLYFDVQQQQRKEEQAKLFRDKYKVPEFEFGPDLLEGSVDPEMWASYRAHRELRFYQINRDMSNFNHHYRRAEAEKDRDTIHGRKLQFDGNRLQKLLEADRAMKQYEAGFELWKKVLLRYPHFREDSTIQEDVYELQIQYMDLVTEYRGPMLRPVLSATGLLAGGALALDGIGAGALPAAMIHQLGGSGHKPPLPVIGPLDTMAPDGQPYVSQSVGSTVRTRMNRDEPVDEQPGATPPPTTETRPGRPR